MNTETARSTYRALRSSCSRLTPSRFDFLAQRIAHELADGEEILPRHWVQAADILVSGQDHA